jgi:hypothetical protein
MVLFSIIVEFEGVEGVGLTPPTFLLLKELGEQRCQYYFPWMIIVLISLLRKSSETGVTPDIIISLFHDPLAFQEFLINSDYFNFVLKKVNPGSQNWSPSQRANFYESITKVRYLLSSMLNDSKISLAASEKSIRNNATVLQNLVYFEWRFPEKIPNCIKEPGKIWLKYPIIDNWKDNKFEKILLIIKGISKN